MTAGLDNLDTNNLTTERSFINIARESRDNRRILQGDIFEIESLRVQSRFPREANQRHEEDEPELIGKLAMVQELMVYEKVSFVKS